MHKWTALKGVDVVGTGDYTHPEWFAELSAELEPAEDGLYRLRAPWRDAVERELPERCRREVRFMLSVEISTIYKKGEKTRKIHHIVILPSLDAVARLNQRLGAIGNLHADGRPILGLDSRDLLEICLEADPDALFVPAHIWTPHFAALGASSGFDSLVECYGDLLPHIFAVETGPSSDPPMNWRLSALDRFALISNSDAHSPQKLAREATLFDAERSYPGIYHALKDRDPARFIGTLEFYPEEGKYHYDGHRKCQVCWKPAQTLSAEGVCPVCGRKLTVGVLHRVELLADRPEGFQPDFAPSCEYLIPLDEVIGAAVGVGAKSKRVRAIYDQLLAELWPELGILRRADPAAIEACAGVLVAEGCCGCAAARSIFTRATTASTGQPACSAARSESGCRGRWYRRRPVRCWHWPGAGIARLVECAVAITSAIYVTRYVLARTYALCPSLHAKLFSAFCDCTYAIRTAFHSWNSAYSCCVSSVAGQLSI